MKSTSLCLPLKRLFGCWGGYQGKRLLALLGTYKVAFKMTSKPGKMELFDLNQIQQSDSARILVDTFCEPDWNLLMTISQYPNVEIRHLGGLRNRLDAGFEESSFDNFWDEAEPITKEKMERMFDFVRFDNKCIYRGCFEHTYLLIVTPDVKEFRRSVPRSAFSGKLKVEGTEISLTYFAGVQIPEDAERVIVIVMDVQLICFDYYRSFCVFGKMPLQENDKVIDAYRPEQGFSIVYGADCERSTLESYSLQPTCCSEKIYMAMEIPNIWDVLIERMLEKLKVKFFADDVFRKSCEKSFFLKWRDASKV